MRKNSIDDIEQDCEAGIIKDRKIWQKFYPGGNMRLEKNRQDQMTPAERITSAGEGKMVDRVITIPFMGELKCYLSGIRSRICIWLCWETGWIRKSRNLVFNLLTIRCQSRLEGNNNPYLLFPSRIERPLSR